MQFLMSHTLRRAGHEVFIACDGKEGVELVRSCSPDLWIFDANMPLLGGTEATAQLRAQFPHAPAILITAGTRASVDNSDDLTHFLAKPFSPPRLAAFVADVLASQ